MVIDDSPGDLGASVDDQVSAERVLIAEDVTHWINYYKATFRDMGFTVKVARSYGEAAALLFHESFSVAIVDLELGGRPNNLDGIFLLEKLFTEGTPAIIVTAWVIPRLADAILEEYSTVFQILDKSSITSKTLRRYIKQAVSLGPHEREGGSMSPETRQRKFEQLIAVSLNSLSPIVIDYNTELAKWPPMVPAEPLSRFEHAVFRLQSYVQRREIEAPECFISYAWDEAEHERWVEGQLATDLRKAGIGVLLDRWENQKVGKSVPRFVERIATCDRVVVVGTPLYRRKYDNKDPVVAAEGELIGRRMIGEEARKESVLPVLLAGSEESSFPPLLHGRVYADFRDDQAYFTTAFDLILSLYEIPFHDRAVADLRESLRERN